MWTLWFLPRLRSGNVVEVRAPKVQHAVQGMASHVHLGCPALIRA